MSSKRLLALTQQTRSLHRGSIARLSQVQQKQQRRWASQARLEEIDLTGGYVNPPRQKRQFRDPYADWWDKQERRDFGEPVHEDHDILGMLSPEEHTHVTTGKALFLIGCSALVVLGVCGAVYFVYPDKPSAPRRFPGGLERELGGPNSVRALSEDDPD